MRLVKEGGKWVIYWREDWREEYDTKAEAEGNFYQYLWDKKREGV